MDDFADNLPFPLADPPPSAAGALFLPGFEHEIEDDPEGLEQPGMGDYTAAFFLKSNPFKTRLVVKLLARGVGVREVAELAGCHVRTVSRLLALLPEEIATETERLKRKIRLGRKMMMESILSDIEDAEKMAKTPVRDKAVTLGILGDQLKGGGPSSLTVHLHAPDHRDMADFLAKLQPADVDGLQGQGMGVPSQIAGGKTGWAAAIEDADEVDPASPGAEGEEVAE